jgi:hypothetical protein
LSGTLNLVSTTGPFAGTDTGDIVGTISWNKPTQNSGNFLASFTTSLNAVGALYTPPTTGATPLPGFTRGAVTLSGNSAVTASGSTALVKNVSLNGDNFAVINPAADKLKITVTPATGVFKGSFVDAPPGVKGGSTIVAGVLFQAGADGAGFFSGTEGAGAVTIAP